MTSGTWDTTARSPFGTLHGLFRSRRDERITLSASLADGLVHERRDPVIVVAGHELSDRASVEFAPRRLEPRGEPLGVLEHVVRYGDGSFHTESMTLKKGRVKVGGNEAGALGVGIRFRALRKTGTNWGSAWPRYGSRVESGLTA